MNVKTNLSYLLPELTVFIAGCFGLLFDSVLNNKRKGFLKFFVFITFILSIFFNLHLINFLLPHFPFFMLKIDGVAILIKSLVLVTFFLTMMLSFFYREIDEVSLWFYFSLLCFVTVGIMLLISVKDFLMLFLSMEVIAIGLFVLVGFRKENLISSESAIKFFLISAFASSITIFGISLLYGLFGSTDFSILKNLVQEKFFSIQIFFIFALILILVGIGFKVALVPFHTWLPDVFQSAPTPITAFISVAPKAAGLVILIRIFVDSFNHNFINLTPLFTILSFLTMMLGNLVALHQTNVKRLLAYSSISHIGYIMLGVIAVKNLTNTIGIEAILFYLFAYMFMNIGAFAVVIAVEKNFGTSELESFKGLITSNQFLSFSMLIFLISLVGIPPTAGFVAKFYILLSAIKEGMVFLPLALVINSVISLFYYFKIVHNMFFIKSNEYRILTPMKGTAEVVFVCLVFTIFLGILPSFFVNTLRASLFSFF